jgi:glucokinase
LYQLIPIPEVVSDQDSLYTETEGLLHQQRLSTDDIAGLGIASPGIVDSIRKRILSIDKKFGDAPDIDLEEWCLQTFNLPFTIENDARSALLENGNMEVQKVVKMLF